MAEAEERTARPASVEDLKLLLGAFDAHGVDYLLIGGYALYALGYQRGTVDIDRVDALEVVCRRAVQVWRQMEQF